MKFGTMLQGYERRRRLRSAEGCAKRRARGNRLAEDYERARSFCSREEDQYWRAAIRLGEVGRLPTHQKLVEMLSANLHYARLEAVSSSTRSRGIDRAFESLIEGTVVDEMSKMVSGLFDRAEKKSRSEGLIQKRTTHFFLTSPYSTAPTIPTTKNVSFSSFKLANTNGRLLGFLPAAPAPAATAP